MGGNKKHEIIKVAQENLYMLKRLNERTSFYNVDKWNKDYETSQYYKKNLCLYSPIDFNKTQRFGTYEKSWGAGLGATPQKNYATRKKFFSKTNYAGLGTIDIPDYRRYANSTRKRKKFEDFNYRDLQLDEKKNNHVDKKEGDRIFKKISEIENTEPEPEKQQEKEPEKEEKNDDNNENNNEENKQEEKEEKEKYNNDKENEGQREEKQNNRDDKEEKMEKIQKDEVEKNDEKNND